MVELPDGITTSNGIWYHTTSTEIKNYIPGLLKKYSIEEIVKNADYWVNSSNGMALVLYLGLTAVGISALISSIIALLFFIIWHYNTSAFVTPLLNPVMRLFDFDGFLYLSTAAVLIWFSFNSWYAEMWAGLALFFLFKVGLLKMLLKWIASKRKSNKAEHQDRILNMLLMRYGIKEGLYGGSVKDMQKNLIKTMNYHKTRKKKK